MVKILALIPARGGSKGIPRKNIKDLCGKPLIAYSIKQALASKWNNRVIVSTDDAEIADIAKKYGAEIPFMRPAEYAQDLSPDIDVFRHALKWVKANEGYIPDIVLHFRPTCPIRNVETIDRAIELFVNTPEADSLRSVRTPIQTPYKMWKIADGFMKPLLELPGVVEPYNLPRQSLPEVYCQTPYLDIVRAGVILNEGKMNGNKILPFIIEEEWVDIDYPEDFKVAEGLLKKKGMLKDYA
ncbi:cytidylyltransferase domain-containing protein [Chloroflexota bacterium]